MSDIHTKKRSRGHAKRCWLFGRFSRNLGYVKRHPYIEMSPDLDDVYICPICFKLFDGGALSTEYADCLTLEDVPPKALGGNARILTCKLCNNQAGTELDSHLSRQVQAAEFLDQLPGVEIETRLQPDPSISLPATTRYTHEGAIKVLYDPNRSDPTHLNRLQELGESWNVSRLTLTFFPGYKVNRPEIALIRIAYLLMFAQFGYGFLLHPSLIPVRQQIAKPQERILPDWGIIDASFPDDLVGVSVISDPRELRSFLVVFNLKTTARETRHGVILPGPTTPGPQVYWKIADLRKENVAIEHQAHVLPEDNYLDDPEDAFVLHTWWDHYCK